MLVDEVVAAVAVPRNTEPQALPAVATQSAFMTASEVRAVALAVAKAIGIP